MNRIGGGVLKKCCLRADSITSRTSLTPDVTADSVKKGRGERLKVDQHPELFSGLIWSGEQALQLGLVDALGSSSYVAREVIGAKDIVDFTREENPFDRFTKKLGTSVAERLALWMGFQGPALR